MEHKYATCFIPEYAMPLTADEYTPWIITSNDPKMLEAEVIEALWRMYVRITNEVEVETFYKYLPSLGYGIYTLPSMPAILGGDDEK